MRRLRRKCKHTDVQVRAVRSNWTQSTARLGASVVCRWRSPVFLNGQRIHELCHLQGFGTSMSVYGPRTFLSPCTRRQCELTSGSKSGETESEENEKSIVFLLFSTFICFPAKCTPVQRRQICNSNENGGCVIGIIRFWVLSKMGLAFVANKVVFQDSR